MQSAPQPVQLSELFGVLRRRIRFVALAAVAGLVLGVLAWVVLPTTYTATTSVELTVPANGSASLDVATEAQLVTTGDVLATAAEQLGRTRAGLKDHISVENPADTAILDISFTDSDPEGATEGSRAVATAFLAVRGKAADDRLQAQRQATFDRIDSLERASERYDADSPARISLDREAEALGNRAAELATIDTTPGQVLGATTTPSAPSSLGLLPLAVAGLAFGLLVGVPVAVMRREPSTARSRPRAAAPAPQGGRALNDAGVLDGTRDARASDTWDIAALMLAVPTELPAEEGHAVAIDGSLGTDAAAGLADALRRRGRQVRVVDASLVAEAKLARGWPTQRKLASWEGELVLVDTSAIDSDALVVSIATHCRQVVLARTVEDDALATRRLRGLLRAQDVDVALTVLLPNRPVDAAGLTPGA